MNARQAAIESARHDASALAGTFGAELSHTFDDIATAGNIIAARMRASNANADLYSWSRDLPISFERAKLRCICEVLSLCFN